MDHLVGAFSWLNCSKLVTMSLLFVVQISSDLIGDVRIVKDMHERKAMMARHADAFIAMPGENLMTYCHSLHVLFVQGHAGDVEQLVGSLLVGHSCSYPGSWPRSQHSWIYVMVCLGVSTWQHSATSKVLYLACVRLHLGSFRARLIPTCSGSCLPPCDACSSDVLLLNWVLGAAATV